MDDASWDDGKFPVYVTMIYIVGMMLWGFPVRHGIIIVESMGISWFILGI